MLLALALLAATLLAIPAAVFVKGRQAPLPPDTGRVAPQPQRAPIGAFNGQGATRQAAAFARRLGRPLDYVHDYLSHDTWTTITESQGLADRWRRAGFAGRTIFTVPILPDTGGTLASGAAGSYNRHFRTLAERLVAGGQGHAILRLGPEFNGDWFAWTIAVADGPRDYVAYWRQIVRTMRAVKGARFRFDWTANAGSAPDGDGGRLSAASAYPGDLYVDFIGLDVFDQSWVPDTELASRRWKELVRQKDGLNWHSRFATARGKPMTFPEWGLAERRDDRGGGDNPYFVEQMHAWIKTHRVAYHLYFESDDPNGDYRMFGGRFPKASERFVRRFGQPGPGSTATGLAADAGAPD